MRALQFIERITSTWTMATPVCFCQAQEYRAMSYVSMVKACLGSPFSTSKFPLRLLLSLGELLQAIAHSHMTNALEA